MQNTTSDCNKNSIAPTISTMNWHLFVWCWIYSIRRVQPEVALTLHRSIWWYSSMSAPLSFSYISRYHICTNLLLLPSVSILLSLFYQSRSLFPLLLFFLPPASSYLSFHFHTNAPDASLSLHPSLLFSLSPLRSLSPLCSDELPSPPGELDR